jgi:hypothetical protein
MVTTPIPPIPVVIVNCRGPDPEKDWGPIYLGLSE